METSSIDVFIGIDVGKADHWATALTRDGTRLFDKALPNDETRLRDLYQRLGERGRVLVVVDQPATIGALAVAVAQDMGLAVGLPAGSVDAQDRGPDTGQRQDRRQGRRGDRRGGPHHAPHAAGDQHLG